MRRVLLLATDLELGGTPTVVAELARRLPSMGWQAEAASLKDAGEVGRRLQLENVPVHALGATAVTQMPSGVRWLHTLVAQRRFDAVLSFLMHANVVAAVASAGLGRVRWVQAIQTAQPKPAWHWPLQAWAATRADAVLVPAPSVAAFAARQGMDAAALRVLPNAIDADAFAARIANHRQKATAAGPWRVGFIGRLDPIKRVPDLVRAMTQAAGELHIYGDGPECAAIEQLITTLGLQNRVRLHGSIADPAAAISTMNVLVLPSDAEGLPLVLIEAMAAGVPMVATRVSGCRDVIRDGLTGLLVPPRSPSQLAGALERLRVDGALRDDLTHAASEDVRQRFSWPAVLPQYVKVLGGTA